ncbi:MAG: glycosyltransferase family 39 protein [Anaerolineales bacterium]
MTAPKLVMFLIGATALAIVLDIALLRVIKRHRQNGTRLKLKQIPLPNFSKLREIRLFHFLRECFASTRDLIQEIRKDERKTLRSFMLAAAIFFSASLGYVHRQALMVEGWQLWAWLGCILFAIVSSLPKQRPQFSLQKSDWWVLVPVLLGLFLRLISLESIPPGLHPDEVTTADFTIRHIYPPEGRTFYPMRSGPYTQPGPFYYLVYSSIQVFGRTFTALRMPGVIAGTIAILATYALIAIRSDRRTALFAALLMSGFHFHMHWSRLALNNVWDTLWIPLTLAAFAWGWKTRWSGGAALSGAALGFSMYFYVGSRITIFLLPILIIQLWREQSDYRQLVVHTGKLLAVAAVVAIPLIIFALDNTDLFLSRATVNWTLSDKISEETGWWPIFKLLANQAWLSFAGFYTYSEQAAFYKSGVPFLIGFTGLFFIVGILWAIYRRKMLPVFWLVLTIFFGGFLIPGPPGTSHLIPAVPAMLWLVAMPLSAMDRNGYKRLVPVLILLMIATDIYFYFGIYNPYGVDPDLSLPFPTIP